MPTRNSWPTRWATVIREKTRAGQESVCGEGRDSGDRDGEEWDHGEWDGGEDVLGDPRSAADDPPEVRPHPEQARASEKTQPTRAPSKSGHP